TTSSVASPNALRLEYFFAPSSVRLSAASSCMELARPEPATSLGYGPQERPAFTRATGARLCKRRLACPGQKAARGDACLKKEGSMSVRFVAAPDRRGSRRLAVLVVFTGALLLAFGVAGAQASV